MTRSRKSVELSNVLWEALELMSREMSVDRDALINQAIFTFARFNGYVVPGQVRSRVTTELPPHPVAEPALAVASTAPGAPPVAVAEAPPPPPVVPPVTAVAPVLPPSRPVTAPPVPDEPPEPAEAEPPEGEELHDGLEELPENGNVEWAVPRHILADAKVTLVKGRLTGHQFHGPVEQFDKKGALLRTIDLGVPVDDERAMSVLVHETRDPKAWKQLAQQLSTAQHFGEAALALARAVGAGDPLIGFTAFLAEHTLVRSDRAARQRVDTMSAVLANMTRLGAPPSRKAGYLVDELLQGTWAPAVLRELAIDQDQFASSRAAADLIRCAKAIDPAHLAHYSYTQALIEMSLGNPDAARVCADEIRQSSEEGADFISTYLNALFPTWDFWPANDPISSIDLNRPEQPTVRRLAELRTAIQKTALRLKSLRERLEALVPPQTPWLLPKVDHLIARSKVTLEPAEQLELEAWQERNLPQLLRFARNEWARLTWLCWLSGLDAVGLPSATTRPRSISNAHRAHALRAGLFMVRAADSSIEENFEEADLDDARLVWTLAWNGVIPDKLDAANAAEVAAPEAKAVTAVFAWAADAAVASPFAGGADDGDDDDDGDEAEDAEDAEEAPPPPVGDQGEQLVGTGEHAIGQEMNLENSGELGEPTGARLTLPQPPVPDEGLETSEPPPPLADRTAISRPMGRKVWVQRQGQDTLELSGQRFVVGRDRSCQIVIASPRVSREHAEIVVVGDAIVVNDLGSSNGTFFNGERVKQHVLKDGDVLQFGTEHITFRLEAP